MITMNNRLDPLVNLFFRPFLSTPAQGASTTIYLATAATLPNPYGGKLKDSIGIPEDQLRKAARSAVCKINIDSDGRLAMTAAIRKVMAEKPEEFDPRKYLGPARDKLKELYKHKVVNVLGSDDKA